MLQHCHCSQPVETEDKHSEEGDEEAEVGVAPHPDGEGEEHHPYGGDVGKAVQQHHAVHQGALLYLEPDQHQHIDSDHGQVVGDEDGKVGSGQGEVLVDVGDVFRAEEVQGGVVFGHQTDVGGHHSLMKPGHKLLSPTFFLSIYIN